MAWRAQNSSWKPSPKPLPLMALITLMTVFRPIGTLCQVGINVIRAHQRHQRYGFPWRYMAGS